MQLGFALNRLLETHREPLSSTKERSSADGRSRLQAGRCAERTDASDTCGQRSGELSKVSARRESSKDGLSLCFKRVTLVVLGSSNKQPGDDEVVVSKSEACFAPCVNNCRPIRLSHAAAALWVQCQESPPCDAPSRD
jgi:hypothetical protein